ncbi:hypothetical protein A2U01_0083291, partial [Trifolium medium]|nr:hypothetical protein [Trifolium medium]
VGYGGGGGRCKGEYSRSGGRGHGRGGGYGSGYGGGRVVVMMVEVVQVGI